MMHIRFIRITAAFLAAAFLTIALISGCSRDPGKNSVGPDRNDGNNNHQPPVPVLRATIGLNLASVASFAAINPGTSGKRLALSRSGSMDTLPDSSASAGPQLFAMTLSGETLSVKLVEPSNSDSNSNLRIQQPYVAGIYPTATWILFSTPGFTLNRRKPDSTLETITCQTIAARRSDGALFCGNIGLQGNPNADTRYDHVQPNAAGDLVYLGNWDPNIAGKELIYALTLGGPDGPVAKPAIDLWIYPQWYVTNAIGDLLVAYYGTALSHNQTNMKAQIVPVGGGTPYVLSDTGYGNLAHGKFGTADENTFYVTKSFPSNPNERTVWAVTKSGSTYIETPLTIAFPGASSYGGIYRLGDGMYFVSGMDKAIVLGIKDGAVVANPTPVPITGAVEFVAVRGSFIQPAIDQIIIFVSTGSGYKFVRLNGVTQQDIPIDPNIEIVGYNTSPNGAIDFTGRRADTQEKVRGEVAAGAATATVTSGGLLNATQTIVFTRIN